MNESVDQATEPVNHYETLGIASSATPDQIRLAYRRAIKICHPDHNHGDPRAAKLFRELTGAYKILRDPEQRLLFDASIGLGHGYRPWYSSRSGEQTSQTETSPELKPFLDAARRSASEGLPAADIASTLIDKGCSYESAWEIAWQARHDLMAERVKYPEQRSGGAVMPTHDGHWHPHRHTLWERLRSGVARIFN